LLRAAREGNWRGERIVVPGAPSGALSEACRQAVEGAPTLFLFDRGGGPVRSRFGRGPAVAQATSVNLPQTYLRNESDLFAELERSLELAVRSHEEKRRLLRRSGHEPQGSTYAVGVAGLDDLTRMLCGKPPAEDDGALKLALRVVSYIYFRIREESAKLQMPLSLEDVPNEAAAERFLRVDVQLYPRARGLSIESYAPGFHLRDGDPEALLAVESRFHTLIPSGRVCVPVSRFGAAADLEALLDRARKETLSAQLHVTAP
ncbi:MAG: anaerobic ribonucleoside-triphosphate reductase, partial [Planctomycetota bacterium]